MLPRDGLARAAIGKAQGLIDQTGNWVIEPKYEFIVHGLRSYFGLVWFRTGKEWGAIDYSGRLVVKPQFSQAGATVCDDGWVIGYVDRSQVDRRLRVARREDAPLPMPDGELSTAMSNCEQPIQIRRGDKVGYLDRMLQPITENKFDEVAAFFHGVAAVKLDGKFGYINRDGTWLIEPRFEEARPMLDDIATVKLGGKFGCIKRDGTSSSSHSLRKPRRACGFLIATIPAKFRHQNPDGTWHIDPSFERIGGCTAQRAGFDFDRVERKIRGGR